MMLALKAEDRLQAKDYRWLTEAGKHKAGAVLFSSQKGAHPVHSLSSVPESCVGILSHSRIRWYVAWSQASNLGYLLQ